MLNGFVSRTARNNTAAVFKIVEELPITLPSSTTSPGGAQAARAAWLEPEVIQRSPPRVEELATAAACVPP